MGLIDFIGKQFIDVIDWVEENDGTLAWRCPMADREIQNGAVLTVRESQLAVFVDEGRVADVFPRRPLPPRHPHAAPADQPASLGQAIRLALQERGLLLQPAPPARSPLGHGQPITIRDKDFGAIRLRAFGNYSYRLADARLLHRQLSGTRERYTVDDLDGQRRGLIVQHISDAVGESGIPFIDLAANLREFGAALVADLAPSFAGMGLALEQITVQNVSLPEELQKLLDQRCGMAMVGGADMGALRAVPNWPDPARDGPRRRHGRRRDRRGHGLGRGPGDGAAADAALQPARAAQDVEPPVPAGASTHDLLLALEELGELHGKGVLTPEEFTAKKAELLRKLGA